MSVDVDLYKFVVGRDGSFVEIDIDTSAALLALQPSLRLFNASGGQIEFNSGENAPGEAKLDADPFMGISLNVGTTTREFLPPQM